MSTSLVLGSEVTHNEKPHLIVRIINSTSLFEEDGDVRQVEESYAELRGPNNEIDFLNILSCETKFVNKQSTIKALPNYPWRVKK